jgi:hypothetical protein
VAKPRKLPGADALFGGKPEPKEAKKPNKETRKQPNKETSKPIKTKTSKPTAPKIEEEGSPDEDLLRYTLFFRPETLEQLEEVWWKLRKKADNKRQFSKWRIVDALLREHLNVEHVRELIDSKG